MISDWKDHFGDDKQTCRYCGQNHANLICPLVTAIEYQQEPGVKEPGVCYHYIGRIELKDRPETIKPLWQVHEEAANG